jgi:transcriptional regulator with XRE-family HTH domain
MPHETSSAAMSLEALPALDWPREAALAVPAAARTRRPAPQVPARPRRRVTLAQIAEETGLSMATVSKVLNGKPDVSARTRALVRQALLTSGYRKRANDDAPPLIDIVFNDFDSPWAIEIVRGAAAAAQAEGLTVAFTALSEGDEQLVQRPTTSPERARSVRPRLR